MKSLGRLKTASVEGWPEMDELDFRVEIQLQCRVVINAANYGWIFYNEIELLCLFLHHIS